MGNAEHEAAYERWLRYERECLLANTAHLTLKPPLEPPKHYPTVVYPREKLLEFRAAYVLLRNAVAELLELNPDTMTQLDVIAGVVKNRWERDRRDAEEV